MRFWLHDKKTGKERSIDYTCVGWSQSGTEHIYRQFVDSFSSVSNFTFDTHDLRIYLDTPQHFIGPMEALKDARIAMIKESYFSKWLKEGPQGLYFEVLSDKGLPKGNTRYPYRCLVAALCRNGRDYSSELARYMKAISKYKNIDPTAALIGFSGFYACGSSHQSFLPPYVFGGELLEGGFIIPTLDELYEKGVDTNSPRRMWENVFEKLPKEAKKAKEEAYSMLSEGDKRTTRPASLAIRYANYAIQEQ